MIFSKIDFLKKEGLINNKAEKVNHPLFETVKFFDPLDLPQVRYEMLRAVRVENMFIVKACKEFGFSREYFYQLEREFNKYGFSSLLRTSVVGCRPVIALNQEIVNYLIYRKIEEPKLSGEKLCKEINVIYKVKCEKRTVERIIEDLRAKKKIIPNTSRSK